MVLLKFFPDDSCCHGNEFLDKIDYNSVSVRDLQDFYVNRGGFRGWAIECCPLNFSLSDPRCHGNEIWDIWVRTRLT